MKWKVLVTDPLSEEGLKILRSHPDIDVEETGKLSEDELVKKISPFDVLLVRSGTKVTAKVIEAASNLKLIGRAGVGLDNVDVETATRKGIIVVNAPSGNTISTAEHTFSLMLALARNIPQAYISMKEGKWERKKFMGVELYNKTLGIIGLGRIGSEVAKRAISFGMRVLGYDPYISEDRASQLGVELVEDIDQMLPQVDFLTLHVPLTSSTKNLINAERLKKMKKGARIINCARGGIVDEQALYEAIKEGHIAGAALDVFEKEPPSPDNPLLSLPNVIFTPHLGASTVEAQRNVAVEIVEEVISFIEKGYVRNAVNIPSIEPHLLEELRPFVDLVEKLGSLHAQLLDGRLDAVELVFNGEIAEKDVSILASAFLKGLLVYILQEAVNYVNAPVIARQRGIRIFQFKIPETKDFANLVGTIVKAGDTKRLIAGTVFEDKNPRIVKVDDFYIDLVPEGNILVLWNRDVPGVIGKVGTLLGSHNINIAGLQLARKEAGGMAMSFIKVDNPIPQSVIDELKKFPEIENARMVKL